MSGRTPGPGGSFREDDDAPAYTDAELLTLLDQAASKGFSCIDGDHGAILASRVRAHDSLVKQRDALLEALLSIGDHAQEFASVEDDGTMVYRMTDKARAALALVDGAL
jgi:hypothetical protein